MGFPDMTVSIRLTCSSSMFYNQTTGPLQPAKPFPHKTNQHVRSLELGKTLMNLLRARCHRSLVSTPSNPPLIPLTSDVPGLISVLCPQRTFDPTAQAVCMISAHFHSICMIVFNI